MIKSGAQKFLLTVLIAIVVITTSLPFCVTATQSKAYAQTVEGAPNTLEELQNADIDAVANLSKFDSRNYGIVTPVKDQGSSDLCWAYATANASETSILRSGIDVQATSSNLILSPESLAYRLHNRDADPLGNTGRILSADYQNWYNKSGTPSYGADVFSQWCGPIRKDLPVTSDAYANTAYRMENAVFIDYKNAPDLKKSAIKKAIVEYGAVTFSYNNVRETEYYNPSGESGSATYPHACTLIGWDDTIPASRFSPQSAKQDGGWIVKNSYLSLPYFYLSYDNDSLSVWAFDYAAKNEYDFNYFYDSESANALTPSNYIKKAANVFEAKKGGEGKSEYVKAVNVGVQGKDVNCTVKVYVNIADGSNPESGTLAGEGTATFDYQGYRTVKLDKPVKIQKGSLFSVVVQVSNDSGNAHIYWAMQSATLANSHTYTSYGTWSKSKYPVRIKAFTSLEDDTGAQPPEESKDISTCEISVAGEYVYTGKAIEPSITVKYNGAVLALDTDYTLNYTDNTNAGTASLTVTGKGKFIGSKQIAFTINKAQRPPTAPDGAITIEWDEALSSIKWADGWSLLNPNETVAENQTKTVTLKYEDVSNYENYTADVTVTRKGKPIIAKKNIADCEIIVAGEYVYTGKAIEPSITVKYNGVLLTLDTDYTVIYSDNVNHGVAYITVSGKGIYEGEKTVGFSIGKAQDPPIEFGNIPILSTSVKLSEIQLPKDWIWENPDEVVNRENSTVRAVYVGKDKDNYETTVIEITLNFGSEKEENKADSKNKNLNKKLWIAIAAVAVAAVSIAIAIGVAYLKNKRIIK